MNDKLKTIGMSIDLKKAFHTIDRTFLIKLYYFYGTTGVDSSWITSYSMYDVVMLHMTYLILHVVFHSVASYS